MFHAVNEKAQHALRDGRVCFLLGLGAWGVGDFDFFSVLNVFSSSFQRFPGSQCVSQDVPNSTTLLSI
jgi:hypothetical protein